MDFKFVEDDYCVYVGVNNELYTKGKTYYYRIYEGDPVSIRLSKEDIKAYSYFTFQNFIDNFKTIKELREEKLKVILDEG